MHHMNKGACNMQNWRSVTDVITAERMIQQLAGVCNGASTWDGAGFSKMDTSFGHSLAQRASQGRAWTVKQAAAALKLITKYSRQIGGKEFVQAWMQAPNFAKMPADAATVKAADRKLTSQDQLAVFRFSYSPELVAAMKTIRGEHKGKRFGARWQPDMKCWVTEVNETSIQQIMQVARDWEFEIEERFESYYTRVQQKLEGVREAAEESRVTTSLGYESGVRVDSDQIVITHTDAAVLAAFKAALARV
jgi:hypothetical protein